MNGHSDSDRYRKERGCRKNFIVELSPGVWLTSKSGRTLVMSSAKRYPTEKGAKIVLGMARKERPWVGAKIVPVLPPTLWALFYDGSVHIYTDRPARRKGWIESSWVAIVPPEMFYSIYGVDLAEWFQPGSEWSGHRYEEIDEAKEINWKGKVND